MSSFFINTKLYKDYSRGIYKTVDSKYKWFSPV